MLRLVSLIERIKGYVHLRTARLIAEPLPNPPSLKPEAVFMLQEAFLRGAVSRGEIIRVSGLAERTGRIVLGQLLKERLLVSDSSKGAVRFGILTPVAGYLFPDLCPGLPDG